jgi:hypothetical protein
MSTLGKPTLGSRKNCYLSKGNRRAEKAILICGSERYIPREEETMTIIDLSIPTQPIVK